MSVISVKHLKKSFGEVTPIKDVNCEIEKGEVISIIGSSGTGKSTFLRCLNGLEKATEGEILVDGINVLDKNTDITMIRRKMGMVFQSFNLFANMMIIENVMLGPVKLLGKSRQEAFDEGVKLLETVGLVEKIYAYPSELSGGQKQRAAIARTIAMKPEIVLFDEPTSALDPTMVGEVLTVIKKLAQQGLTMLIVTHEMAFAREVSSRVFYMDCGEIYEQGTPAEVFDNPNRERTRAFINKLKLYQIEIHSKKFDFIGVNSGLEEFAQIRMMAPQMIKRIELVFEELCMNLILPSLDDIDPYVNFTVEYSDFSDAISIECLYNGPDNDPLTDDITETPDYYEINIDDVDNVQKLSKLYTAKIAKDYSHSYVDNMNKIRFSLD